MADFYEAREALDPDERESAFFRRLAPFLGKAMREAPGLKRQLGDIDAGAIASRQALAALPVLRKDALMRLQAEDPPFGGFAPPSALRGTRVFASPGPIFEPQGPGPDPWGAGRAVHAAGFRAGDMVVNAYAYHLTPGGFIMEEGARAVGCVVLPAGPGNSEAIAAAIAALGIVGYLGTPDFLKVLLDKAQETGRDASSLKKALVSGGALFPSLREEYFRRGVTVLQAYATADIGVIAYETIHEGNLCEGLVVNEDILVEIVRPGTGDPVPDGEVGEVVVTTLNPAYPLVRFGTGDLSAVLPGASPCGRTNMRLKGWMGRADQRTKVRGMFVDPAMIANLLKRHPEILRARLVVTRQGDQDAMRLEAEAAVGKADADRLVHDLHELAGMRGDVSIVAAGSLPNDGKVIDDQRRYE